MTARRLSMMDSSHLQMETATMHMHIAALMIFEQPTQAPADFVGQLVSALRSSDGFSNPWNYRLRRPGRLQFMPQLEEVTELDLDYHVRHLALPHPAGERELGQLVSRLHSQKLDQRRPLWEAYVIEGLTENRFALYLKLHHSLVDGVSAAQLIARGLSNAVGQPIRPFWSGEHAPAKGGSQPDDNPLSALAQGLPRPRLRDGMRDMRSLGQQLLAAWTGGNEAEVCLRKVPQTPFNQRVSPQRRVATHSESLARIKAIAKLGEASVNDVVLSLMGGVIRRYLSNQGDLPRESLTAMIPVSLHAAGSDKVGNNIAQIITTVGTDIADAGARLQAVKAASLAAKARLQAVPKSMAPLYSNLLLAPYSAALVSGGAGRMKPVFNVVVSNVMGPREPLYLGEARLSQMFPVSVPLDGAALNVTCFSYAGELNFGLTACRDSLPHMQQMAVSLGDELAELERALKLEHAA